MVGKLVYDCVGYVPQKGCGIGGFLIQQLAGHLTDYYKATPHIAYSIMFGVCGLAYLIAWSVIKMLTFRNKAIPL
jgi:MFS transporter, ACS family, hexuronate transporter